MTTKPGKLATNAAHLAKLDRIVIQPYKADGQEIRKAAAAAGQSLQGYILDTLKRRIESEKAGGALCYIPAENTRSGAERDGITPEEWTEKHNRPKKDSK